MSKRHLIPLSAYTDLAVAKRTIAALDRERGIRDAEDILSRRKREDATGNLQNKVRRQTREINRLNKVIDRLIAADQPRSPLQMEAPAEKSVPVTTKNPITPNQEGEQA